MAIKNRVYGWGIQSPQICSQVFTCDGLHHDNAFPFVYVLQKNKSDETYTTMLHQTKLRTAQLK